MNKSEEQATVSCFFLFFKQQVVDSGCGVLEPANIQYVIKENNTILCHVVVWKTTQAISTAWDQIVVANGIIECQLFDVPAKAPWVSKILPAA